MDEDQVREIVRDEMAKVLMPVASAAIDALMGIPELMELTPLSAVVGGLHDLFGTESP